MTKVEQGGRNVVVSRRELLEAEAAAARAWETIRVGAVLSGTVSAVRDFGAFIDLGGVERMIHVSELGTPASPIRRRSSRSARRFKCR